jgi:molybdenum cofactor cytidylyltransferase
VASIEGILLAAGESRRMGYPKPLLRIGERTFLAHLCELMLSAAPRLIVVLGAHAERVRSAIAPDQRITVVENADYARGQLSSLKAGLKHVSPDAHGVLVHLADHPVVRPSTFWALLAEHHRAGKPIVITRYQGRRGHPVIFERSVFSELERAPESEGARAVVNADPSRVAYLDVDDPGVVLDLDTPDDLARAGLPPPP